ncbi:MAG: sensor histidine kinase [Planctomycetes bacterium]|nr:sensor histidine kinase [Planctomycetota bacterium]
MGFKATITSQIVLRNLLTNAVKYGDPKTVIEVELEVSGEERSISVTNAGPNIPEQNLKKLFQKFVRLDAAQGTRGSELGLYNARKIVELWGGTIRVESSENHTRFVFTL